jgi:hypothetical protein
MEKKISIVFTPEYLIVAMAPANRFEVIKDSDNQDKFWLYFFTGLELEIDNSDRYKEPFLENKPGYFGDIYELLLTRTTFGKYSLEMGSLFKPMLERIKKKYVDALSQLSDSFEELDGPIFVSAIAHSSIKKEAFEVLKKYFEEIKLRLSFSPLSFPYLFIRSQYSNIQAPDVALNFIIIDGLTDDLKFIAISMGAAGAFDTIGDQLFDNEGMDPRLNIILSQIIDDINRKEGLELTPEKKSFYMKKYSSLARQVLENLNKSSSGRFKLEMDLLIDGISYHYSFTFQKKVIENTVQDYIHKIRIELEHFLARYKLTHQTIGKVFILGDSLNIEGFQGNLNLESQKVISLRSDEVYTGLLKELLANKVESTSVKTDSNIDKIESSLLNPGTQIEVGWISSKGSFRHLKATYVSNKKFSVFESENCDLKTGMDFTSDKLEFNKVNALKVGNLKFNTGPLTILRIIK